MTTSKLVCPIVFFISGLGVGALWSPFEERRVIESPNDASVQAENEELVAQAREMYGDETAEFVKQFEDMTIRIKKAPIDAWASLDGRFVIRLVGNGEIASDLWYPGEAGVKAPKERVRQYSFSDGNRNWSCAFWRTINNPVVTTVEFCVTDAHGRGLSYVDSDADGQWDRLIDEAGEQPVFYERDGLCWKERADNTAR